MRPKWISAILTLFALTACSDYTLQKKVEYAPEIVVTPLEHDFGALNADGQNSLLDVLIENVGTDTLEVHDLYLLYETENFTLQSLTLNDLEPGEELIASIIYDPRTYENNIDVLSIHSNDEDEYHIEIPLIGTGDAPIISVSPLAHDFSMVFLGCDEGIDVAVSNVGNVDLEINQVDYYASGTNRFLSGRL